MRPMLFRFGVVLIGFGGGLFAVATLTTAMEIESGGMNGLAVGIWGAVQASAAGLSIALGGALRDIVAGARRDAARSGRPSPTPPSPTASSTTSRSRCSSPRSSPSARSCAAPMR